VGAGAPPPRFYKVKSNAMRRPDEENIGQAENTGLQTLTLG